jgi:hypothetical protein
MALACGSFGELGLGAARVSMVEQCTGLDPFIGSYHPQTARGHEDERRRWRLRPTDAECRGRRAAPTDAWAQAVNGSAWPGEHGLDGSGTRAGVPLGLKMATRTRSPIPCGEFPY